MKRTFWKLSASGNFTPTLRQDLVFLHTHQKTLPLQSISQTCFPEGSASESQRVIPCGAQPHAQSPHEASFSGFPPHLTAASLLSLTTILPHRHSAFQAPCLLPLPLSLCLSSFCIHIHPFQPTSSQSSTLSAKNSLHLSGSTLFNSKG